MPILKTIYFFCICMVVIACENDVNEVKALGKKNTGVEEGKNIESLLSNNGKLKAKLTAPIMLRYQFDSAMVEFPKTLHVLFYDSLTRVESVLDAKYGRYLENSNKVFLKDSVQVFNVKGDTLWCNELYWDQAKQTFFTDKPAIISQAQQKICAKEGLIADQNFKWFTLIKVGRNYTGKDNYINIPDSTY
jgi:LPS export ABC transporter protein LptC